DQLTAGARFIETEPNLMAGIRANGDKCQMLVNVWDAGVPWANYSVSSDKNHLHLQIIAADGGDACSRGELMDVQMVRFTPECPSRGARSRAEICVGNNTVAGLAQK